MLVLSEASGVADVVIAPTKHVFDAEECEIKRHWILWKKLVLLNLGL